MSLGERGHSYVKITLSYTALAPPGQFTTVNVSMDCVTASERIISSVSFMVTSPGQTVREVKCPQLSGPQQSVHVEVTKRETSERHGELHFAVPQVPVSFDAGISQESEQTRIESGTRESQISINGFRHSQDTAHWTLEAARGIGSERDSVPKTLRDLSFTLEEKPAVFHFECFVTTTRGGKKADRWAGSLGALNKGKRLFGLISIM
ncbi:hypothetical protein C8R46DRAFT_546125 [Mycena filopes]|nr:hypothetical protein C8R46DRAFT_546125 [Mycena filopes]